MPKRSAKLSPSIVELDGPFQHGHVHTHGLRLHTVSAGSTTDPLIMLLHGAFSGWFEYRHIIAELADAGFHVVAVDLRGYGMTIHRFPRAKIFAAIPGKFLASFRLWDTIPLIS